MKPEARVDKCQQDGVREDYDDLDEVTGFKLPATEKPNTNHEVSNTAEPNTDIRPMAFNATACQHSVADIFRKECGGEAGKNPQKAEAESCK